MSSFTQSQIAVIKVGTSTLTYGNGRLNIRCIEELCRTISDLQNSGRHIVLVSSGAVGVGMGKLKINTRPKETAKKQAIAAVGQCELMFMYDKLFGEYNQTVAQVLLTADDLANVKSRKNVENTFEQLIAMNIIPIVNENDTVSTAEMRNKDKIFGENDTLSAIVAECVGADVLVILTDIDGMYDGDPRNNPEARRIPYIKKITPEIEALAGDPGTNFGTGGMTTKVNAAKIATTHGIACCVMSGAKPKAMHRLFDGEMIGTIFEAQMEEK